MMTVTRNPVGKLALLAAALAIAIGSTPARADDVLRSGKSLQATDLHALAFDGIPVLNDGDPLNPTAPTTFDADLFQLALGGPLGGGEGGGGDPGGLPPCANGLQAIVGNTLQDLAQQANACVTVIQTRIANGNTEGAFETAGNCIGAINTRAATGINNVRDLCDTCLETLVMNDAPLPVVDALLDGCRHAIDVIRAGRRAAVGAVTTALRQGIAQSCIGLIRDVGRECRMTNRMTALACVQQINALLEEGDVPGALQTAQACRQQVLSQTAACVQLLNNICRECVDTLVELGADRCVIGVLIGICDNQIGSVINSAQEAIGAINDALPTPPDGGPDDVDEMP